VVERGGKVWSYKQNHSPVPYYTAGERAGQRKRRRGSKSGSLLLGCQHQGELMIEEDEDDDE